MKIILILSFIILFSYLLVSPPYNTETVCFNGSGDLIFYQSGYHPDSWPIVEHLSDNIYKHKKTGEKIEGECKSSWGTTKPKGKEYWSLNSD